MIYIMLSGIPTSGKSTYVSFLLQKPEFHNAVVLSTDNYIEKVAKENNLSYNEVFENEIKAATKQLNVDLSEALKNNRPIIHDQTNLTQKSRAKKLKKIPDHYKKICAYSVIDLEEAQKRNKTRPGKVISTRVIMSMLEDFSIPTLDEGFDEIINIPYSF
jgi:predicted kinase